MTSWVERAVDFTRSLKRHGANAVRKADASPPMTTKEFAELDEALPLKIPESLKVFLLKESASCECEYYITIPNEPTQDEIDLFGQEMAHNLSKNTIYGGASLCQSHCFCEWNSEDWKSVFDDINPECAELWRNSFIFKFVNNGDALGLYVATEKEDPPVVYLNHEEEIHRPLAPTLSYFLQEWEKLRYLGPEFWILQDFIDEKTGYIDANLALSNQNWIILNESSD